MLNNDQHNAWEALDGVMSKEDFLLIMPNSDKEKMEKTDIVHKML